MERIFDKSETIERLLDLKLRAGFHRILGLSSKRYTNEFSEIAKPLFDNPVSNANLTLVEERIGLQDQIKALQLDVNEGVFRFPESEISQPHAEWVRIVGRLKSLSNHDQLEFLPTGLRSATPIEGINGDIESLTHASVSLLMAGGEEHKHSSLILERFLGKPRISFTYINDNDQHIDILAVFMR